MAKPWSPSKNKEQIATLYVFLVLLYAAVSHQGHF